MLSMQPYIIQSPYFCQMKEKTIIYLLLMAMALCFASCSQNTYNIAEAVYQTVSPKCEIEGCHYDRAFLSERCEYHNSLQYAKSKKIVEKQKKDAEEIKQQKKELEELREQKRLESLTEEEREAARIKKMIEEM